MANNFIENSSIEINPVEGGGGRRLALFYDFVSQPQVRRARIPCNRSCCLQTPLNIPEYYTILWLPLV